MSEQNKQLNTQPNAPAKLPTNPLPQPALTTANNPVPGSGVVTGNPNGSQVQVNSPAPLVARPLMGPEFTNVKWKPGLTGRYILRTDPGKNNSNLRYEQALAQGFRVATPADCEVPGLAPQEGKFINGDLILMCMSREKYDGAMLYNHQQSTLKADHSTLVRAARNEIQFRNNPAYRVTVFSNGVEADNPQGGVPSLAGRPDMSE